MSNLKHSSNLPTVPARPELKPRFIKFQRSWCYVALVLGLIPQRILPHKAHRGKRTYLNMLKPGKGKSCHHSLTSNSLKPHRIFTTQFSSIQVPSPPHCCYSRGVSGSDTKEREVYSHRWLHNTLGFVRWLCHCENITECTYTNPDGTAYHTRLGCVVAYCSQATNLHNMLLYCRL